jgi:hypothetical protein
MPWRLISRILLCTDCNQLSRNQPARRVLRRVVRNGQFVSNNMVVLAIFNDEASADVAAASLKESGMAKKDAIGVLALNDKGELKTEKVGKRSLGKGAGIGAAVALVTPVGLAAGLIGGGLAGALHHKNLGLSKADRERIGGELQGGKAAVGVLAPVEEASIVSDKLTELGGTAESHAVSDEALQEAHTAAENSDTAQ